MTRIVAILTVLGIAGAQAASLTCDLLCAPAPTVASHGTGGCHAHADNAAGMRLTSVPSRCDHDGLGPWLVEPGQRAPQSVTLATLPSTDRVVTSDVSIRSAHSLRWLLLESPPPLGGARSTILRI